MSKTLPSTLKNAVRRRTPKRVRQFIARVGKYFEKADYPYPSQEGTLHLLKDLGWQPQSCVDVGAYHGDWALMFHAVFPKATILMIEAQQSKEPQLRKIADELQGIDYRIQLLGAENDREVDFNEMETGSSVFEEASPYARKRVKKRLMRLDAVVSDLLGRPGVDMLKLDTQGYELEVLKGAGSLMSSIDVILLEASLIPSNNGAPLIGEVIEFMNQNGFILFDVCSLMRRKDHLLWQLDLVFIRKDGPVQVNCRLDHTNWG